MWLNTRALLVDVDYHYARVAALPVNQQRRETHSGLLFIIMYSDGSRAAFKKKWETTVSTTRKERSHAPTDAEARAVAETWADEVRGRGRGQRAQVHPGSAVMMQLMSCAQQGGGA